MAWSAKPSGAYTISSTEGTGNILEANGFMNDKGYQLEAQAGLLANCYHESGLNPWRWQSDTYNTSNGYGLFQFTPASGYLALSNQGILGFAPNLSTTVQTQNANPYDGWAQLIVVDEDILGKWMTNCWRSYWSPDYDNLLTLRQQVLDTYGNGSSLTYQQFKNIGDGTGQYGDIAAATFAFMACYEGPLIPNAVDRIETARQIWSILSGDTPPDPPEPTPGIGRPHTMPLYLYFI